jgi:hypothetical protein
VTPSDLRQFEVQASDRGFAAGYRHMSQVNGLLPKRHSRRGKCDPSSVRCGSACHLREGAFVESEKVFHQELLADHMTDRLRIRGQYGQS